MAKARTAYLCSECGAHSVKWAGQCPDCGAWNTLSETSIVATPAASGVAATRLDRLPDDLGTRHATGFGEFDRVLGGGLVPGAVTLLGGDPGVGKSTLLQQVSASLARDLAVCYATGEESLRQIGQRSLRLGLAQSEMNLLADTALENVLDQARQCRAKVVVIDSIQTMTCNDLPSAPGSVAQLREGVGRLVQFAKQSEVSVFIIGHVTKEGTIAGPRVVEHMVDTVLYFESDPSSRYTMIRSVKNRFGASGEMGVFAMTEAGFREVSNPSAIFLSRESVDEPGSIFSVAWEGGLRISETAVDLPILLSIVSSFRDRATQDRLICFGEIGLAGEIRPIKFGTERIAAAAKQGFTRAIVPRGNVPRKVPGEIEVIGVRRLSDALDQAW